MAYGNRAYSEAGYSALGINPDATVGVTGVRQLPQSEMSSGSCWRFRTSVTSEPIATYAWYGKCFKQMLR